MQHREGAAHIMKILEALPESQQEAVYLWFQSGLTEAYSRIDDNPFFKTQHDSLSTFSVDVDSAAYSNLRRFLAEGHRPPKDAVRIEEMINYFTTTPGPRATIRSRSPPRSTPRRGHPRTSSFASACRPRRSTARRCRRAT